MRKRKFWYWVAGVATLAFIGLTVAGIVLSRRFEPFIKEQTVLYLEKRFDSEAKLGSLKVSMPMESPLRVLLNKGRGAQVRVEGRKIELRHKGRTDVPPMFAMDRFFFEVDLHSFGSGRRMSACSAGGNEAEPPPKGERPLPGGAPRLNRRRAGSGAGRHLP